MFSWKFDTAAAVVGDFFLSLLFWTWFVISAVLPALRGRNFHSPSAFERDQIVLQPPARDENSQVPRRSSTHACATRDWGRVDEDLGCTRTNTWPAWERLRLYATTFLMGWSLNLKKEEFQLEPGKKTLSCWRSCGVLWELHPLPFSSPSLSRFSNLSSLSYARGGVRPRRRKRFGLRRRCFD